MGRRRSIDGSRISAHISKALAGSNDTVEDVSRRLSRLAHDSDGFLRLLLSFP